jgi:predicted proteasome-type protease
MAIFEVIYGSGNYIKALKEFVGFGDAKYIKNI